MKFGVDVFQMKFNRADGYDKRRSDLLVAFTLQDKFDHFHFTFAQLNIWYHRNYL